MENNFTYLRFKFQRKIEYTLQLQHWYNHCCSFLYIFCKKDVWRLIARMTSNIDVLMVLMKGLDGLPCRLVCNCRFSAYFITMTNMDLKTVCCFFSGGQATSSEWANRVCCWAGRSGTGRRSPWKIYKLETSQCFSIFLFWHLKTAILKG